eukprot:Em0014g911a
MNRSRSLLSDPEFLLQFMEFIDSDCSDDDFDGYVDEVTETLLKEPQLASTQVLSVMDLLTCPICKGMLSQPLKLHCNAVVCAKSIADSIATSPAPDLTQRLLCDVMVSCDTCNRDVRAGDYDSHECHRPIHPKVRRFAAKLLSDVSVKFKEQKERAESIAKKWGLSWPPPDRKGQWGRMSKEFLMKQQLYARIQRIVEGKEQEQETAPPALTSSIEHKVSTKMVKAAHKVRATRVKVRAKMVKAVRFKMVKAVHKVTVKMVKAAH